MSSESSTSAQTDDHGDTGAAEGRQGQRVGRCGGPRGRPCGRAQLAQDRVVAGSSWRLDGEAAGVLDRRRRTRPAEEFAVTRAVQDAAEAGGITCAAGRRRRRGTACAARARRRRRRRGGREVSVGPPGRRRGSRRGEIFFRAAGEFEGRRRTSGTTAASSRPSSAPTVARPWSTTCGVGADRTVRRRLPRRAPSCSCAGRTKYSSALVDGRSIRPGVRVDGLRTGAPAPRCPEAAAAATGRRRRPRRAWRRPGVGAAWGAGPGAAAPPAPLGDEAR